MMQGSRREEGRAPAAHLSLSPTAASKVTGAGPGEVVAGAMEAVLALAPAPTAAQTAVPALEFESVTAAYRPGLPPVLSDLTFSLAAGARCGVVGRTGSGKSSLLLVLFRLIEMRAGRVVMGGVDTARIGIDALRRQLAIIPQVRFGRAAERGRVEERGVENEGRGGRATCHHSPGKGNKGWERGVRRHLVTIPQVLGEGGRGHTGKAGDRGTQEQGDKGNRGLGFATVAEQFRRTLPPCLSCRTPCCSAVRSAPTWTLGGGTETPRCGRY